MLGGRWLERVAVPQKGGIHEFVLQYKGCRKSFSCLGFYQELKRWKSSEMALQRISSRLHHSTNHITANHYLKDLDSLDLDTWGCYTPSEILGLAFEQTKLDLFDLNFNKSLGSDNRQSRMQDFI